MKKIKVLALVLAALMCATAMFSCGGGDDSTTTTTAATKATTTTKKTTTSATTAPEEPDPDPEVPKAGADFDAWHNAMALITPTNVTTAISTWGDGPVASVWDGIDGYFNKLPDPAVDDGLEILGTKIGGSGAYEITFECASTKLTAYSFVTAWDASKYLDRTPASWTLYGSNDNGTTWTIIDDVFDGQIDGTLNNTPYGYEIDADKQAAYTQYKFEFTWAVSNSGFNGFQLNEIYLYTTK